MELVLRTGIDPLFQKFDLGRLEGRFFRLRRRHPLIGVIARYARNHFARLGIAGHNHRLLGGFFFVEPEVCFS